MNLNREFITLQITGHNPEKGYIYGIVKDGTDAKITLVQNKNSNRNDFVTALSDSTKNTFAQVGSHIVAYGINIVNADTGFVSANYGVSVTKEPDNKFTFVTPVKIDKNPIQRQGDNGPFITLSANVLDAEYTPIHQIKGLRKQFADILKGESDKSVPGYSRGLMVRIGQKQPNGQKVMVPYEFYAYPNESANSAINRLYNENGGDNKFRRMLQRLQREIAKTNSLVEASGLSRVSFNDYGSEKNLNKHFQDSHYKTKVNGTARQAYSLAAISVNKKTLRIDNIQALPRVKVKNSVSGLVGRHNDQYAPYFSCDTVGASQNVQAPGAQGFPLRINRQLDNGGRLTRFAVTGSRSVLNTYQSRIESAAVGIKPFYQEASNSYIFPATAYKEVASSLSDLTGSPAIYLSEQKQAGGAQYVYVNGRVSESPFSSRLNTLASELSGERIEGAYRFPENQRLQLESGLGELLQRSARPENAVERKFTLKFPDYASWQEKKYNWSGNAMKDAHFDQIASFAEEAGIDWSSTAPNIFMPSPDSGTEVYKSNKSRKDVHPNREVHSGSCMVVASTYRYKSKSTQKEHLGIYLKFINRKMGGGEFFTEFKSGEFDFSLYESERGAGKIKTGGSSPEELARREAENQSKREKRAKEAAEKTKTLKQNALLLWGEGSDATGQEPYHVRKGINDHIHLMDMRVSKTEHGSTFSMYQLVDEYQNFAGLQKIYDKGWLDDKGRKINKVFTEGTEFNDADTGIPLGTHGPVGVDDGKCPIVYAEGMADTVSAVASTGYFGKIGVNKHNLKLVVQVSVHNNPNREHIVVGDNDHNHKDGNIGAKAALDAAWENGVKWMIPNFDGLDTSSDSKDINDLHQLAGLAEVNKQIQLARPAPRNILEYYNTRLTFENEATYDDAFKEALDAINVQYPQMDPEKIKVGLAYERKVTPSQSGQANQATQQILETQSTSDSESKQVDTQSPAQVEEEFNTGFPILIEEKVTLATQKKYLVIRDSSGGVYAEPIAKAIEECMPGRQALFHSELKSYVAPAHLKNILNSKLHKLTGAPANYIGQRMKSQGEGFVIRGDLPEEIIEQIEQKIGFINGYYDSAEMGYVVENDLAIYLIQEALGERLSSTQPPKSFTALETQYTTETLNSSSLKDRANEFGVKVSDVAKMQAFLSVKEKDLPRDGYWFAGLCASIKASEQKNGEKASYSHLIKKAYNQATSLFIAETYSDEQFISNAPIWHHLGQKYGWEAEALSSESVEEQTTEILPEQVSPESASETPESENVVEETADSEITTPEPAAETETHTSVIEHIDVQPMELLQGNSATRTSYVESSPVQQDSLFAFLEADDGEVTDTADSIETPSFNIETEVSAEEAITDNSEGVANTQSKDHAEDEAQVEVLTEASNDTEDRIRSLHDTITLLVENGYTHDEFLSVVIDSPDCIGYQAQNGEFDKTLLQADFFQIANEPISDLKNFHPTSLSSAYYQVYNIVSANRLDDLKEFINELLDTKGALSEKSFTKYVKGTVSSISFSATQPYLEDGEYNEELLNEDLSHHTDFKHVNELYREIRDSFKADHDSHDTEVENTSESTISITVNDHKESARQVYSDDKVTLYRTDETNQFVIKSGNRIQLAEMELVKSVDKENESLSMHKMFSDNKVLYLVTKPDSSVKVYPRFGDASAYFRSQEANFIEVANPEVIHLAQPTQRQIENTLAAYYSDGVEVSEIIKRVEQKFRVSVDESTRQLISDAFTKHVEKHSQKPVSQTEKLSALQKQMAEVAQTELLFHEYYDDYFKADGYAYESNPFYVQENGVIDRKGLNASLSEAGYKSIKHMYQDVFESVVNLSHDQYNATKIGGFIPNGGFKQDIDLDVQFENLVKVLNRAPSANASSQILPFKDYIGSSTAYQAINDIQAESLSSLADPAIAEKYSVDEYLLLADLHHVTGVSASNSKTEIAEQIISTWKLRQELTFMSESELAGLDLATLSEYANKLGVSTTSHNQMYARKIKEKLDDLKDATHTKVAQYNYIADAIASIDAGQKLPAYVYRDLGEISNGDVLTIGEITRYKRQQFENANTRQELATSLNSINMLTPEARGVMNAVDMKAAYVVGIEDAKYASKSYAYAIPEAADIDRVQLPIDVSYHTVINDKLIGLNKPLDHFWIAEHGYIPISPNAMKAVSKPIERYIEATGYLGFRDANGNSALVRPSKRGFIAIEYNGDSGEVSTRKYKYTSEFIETYRAKGFEFSDLDPIMDQLALNESADQVDQLTFIRELKSSDLSGGEIVELAALINDDIAATDVEKANVALSRIESSITHTLTHKLTLVGEPMKFEVKDSYPNTIAALQQSRQIQTQHALADEIELDDDEHDQPLNDTGEANNTDLFAMFSDAPEEVMISESVQVAPENILVEGKRVVTSDGEVGTVSSIDGAQLSLVAEWQYEIQNTPSLKDKLVDKQSGRYLFTMELSEFTETQAALHTDIDLNLLNPRDPNGTARIEALPLASLKELNRLLANPEWNGDREALTSQVIEKVQARAAGRLYSLGEQDSATDAESNALSQFTDLNNPVAISEWYASELKKSKSYALSVNFEKAVAEAMKLGFEPGQTEYTKTVSASKVSPVNEALMVQLANEKTIQQILQDVSPEAKYLKARYLDLSNLSENETKLLLESNAKLRFNGPNVEYVAQSSESYPALQMLLDHQLKPEQEPAFRSGQEVVLVEGDNVRIATVSEPAYPDDEIVMVGESEPVAFPLENAFLYEQERVETLTNLFLANAEGTLKEIRDEADSMSASKSNLKDSALTRMSQIAIKAMLDELENNGDSEFLGYELYLSKGRFGYFNGESKTDSFSTIDAAQKAIIALNKQVIQEEKNADEVRHSGVHGEVLFNTDGAVEGTGSVGDLAGEQNPGDAGTADIANRSTDGINTGSRESRLSPADSLPSIHSGAGTASRIQGPASSNRAVTFTYPDDLEENIAGLPKKIELNLEALRISKLIAEEDRPATDEEKYALAHYTGWGGMPGMFDRSNYTYFDQRRKLFELVTSDEYNSIKESALTAFYTPPSIIKEVYFGASKFGFVGGEVSDPSTGIGSFLSAMPRELKEVSNVTARELDNITARIAQQIHGDKIIKHGGFENAKQPNNYFDLITSNIPFGNFSVFDPDYAQYGYKIHDYFLVKNIDKVKPGGLVAFITSTGTLDKADDAARQHVYKTSDLVAAVRLPSKTFAKYANTHVGADVVFFRKRLPGEEPMNADWLSTESIDVEDRNGNFHIHSINRYFTKNPQMIIGETISVRGQFGYELSSSYDGDIAQALHNAIESAPTPRPSRKSYDDNAIVIEDSSNTESVLIDNQNLRPGSFTMAGGELGVAVSKYNPDKEDYDLIFEPISVKGKKAERLTSLIQLRDQVRSHINLQTSTTGMPDSLIESMALLNILYDKHVKKYGYLNDSSTKQAFLEDPDYPLLMGLETVDKATQEITKTNLFFERTIGKRSKPTTANTADEAFAISMAWDGQISPQYVSELLGKEWDTVVEENRDTLFLDPNSANWVHHSQYLSGNILEKLECAKVAAELNPSFDQNVAALEKTMPEPVLAEEIKVRLGSGWVPTEIISRFVEKIITGEETPFPGESNSNFKVSLVAANWEVGVSDWNISSNDGRTRNRYGTQRINAAEIIEKVLNGSKIEICDTIEEKRVVNVDQTAIANSKAQDIKEAFNNWIWNDSARKQYLTDLYNRRFNVFVEAKYDGSQIQYTGLSPTFNGQTFSPRQTQRNTLMRYFQEGRALLAHGVGTGKSFELASIAIEGKARNLHQKPVVAVPNNVFGQLSRSIQQHYPNARVLSLDPRQMDKSKRLQLTSKIATGNWDCIVVAHSTLDKLSAPKEFVDRQLQQQIWELASFIDSQDSSGSFTNKRAQRKLKNLEHKLKKRLEQDSKDDLLYLNELGIDAMLVDEADNFLNLGSPSNMAHVNGVNTQESKRAMNMLFMTRFIQEQNNNRGVVWATGTDIRKSMSDLYVNLYVLAPDELKRLGLDNFDSFMSVFGEVVTTIEANPEGTGYRENSRLAKFNNLPELGQLYRTVADVVTAEMAGVVKPESTKIPVKCQGNEYFTAFMKDIARRATGFRNGTNDESWFAIQHASQLAAMDMRCVDASIPEAPHSKIASAAQNILEEFKVESERPRAQLVFIDRFVNPTAGGFSVYDDLINKLVDGGIPRDKIVDSRQVVSETQKKNFEDGMNSGKYLVAIGTTERFGVGNNIQTNLVAMHELTPPWNPRDLEQRLGRIERHGNTNSEVNVYRYSTENSFDLFQWETMKRKASFIQQTKLEPKLAPREYTEEADATYSEMMAIATGNTLIKDKIEVDAELQKMERLKRSHIDGKRQMQYSIKSSQEYIDTLNRNIEFVQQFIDKLSENAAYNYNGISYGQDFKAGAEVVKAIFKQLKGAEMPTLIVPAGNFGDLELKFRLEDKLNGKKAYVLKAYVGKESVKVSNNAYVESQMSDLSGLLHNLVGSKEDSLAHIQKEKDRVASLEKELQQPFEKESELAALSKRAEQLNKELLIAANEAANSEDDIDWEILLGKTQRDANNQSDQSGMSM